MSRQSSNDQSYKADFTVFANILNNAPTKSAKIDDPRFDIAISHTSDILCRLISKDRNLSACSTLKLAELQKKLKPAQQSLTLALDVLTALKKLNEDLNAKQDQLQTALLAQNVNAGNASDQRHRNERRSERDFDGDALGDDGFDDEIDDEIDGNANATSNRSHRRRRNRNNQVPSHNENPAVIRLRYDIGKSYLEGLNKITTSLLDKFYQDGQILIPLSSHLEDKKNAAILCELRKNKNGEIEFLVWNTGIGLNLHASSDHEQEDKHYAPVRVFKCDNIKNISKSDLQIFVKSLLKPALSAQDGNNELNPETFATQLIGQVSFLKGTEIDSSKHYKKSISGQPEGSTAWHVVQSYLNNTVFTEQEADEIQYEFMRNALESMLEELAERQDEIRRIPQLKEELENIASQFSLSLQQTAKRLQFSAQRQQQGLSLVERVKQLCGEAQADVALIDAARLSQFNAPAVSDIHIHAQHHERFHEVRQDTIRATNAADFVIEPVSTMRNLDDAYDQMQKILSNLASSKQNRDADADADHFYGFRRNRNRRNNNSILHDIKTLTNFLNALPLTDAFVNQPHQVKANDFALRLQNVMGTYIKLCHRHDDIPFGERQVALYSAIALIEQIANKHFENQPDILKKIYETTEVNSISDALAENMPVWFNPVLGFFNLLPARDKDTLPTRHKAFELSLCTHYFTSIDSNLQTRLTAVKSILTKNPSKLALSGLTMLDELAGMNPDIMSEAGQRGNARKAKQEAGKYFLDNQRRIAQTHPAAYQDATLCMAYKSMKHSVNEYLASSRYYDWYGAELDVQSKTHEDNLNHIHYHRQRNGSLFGSDNTNYVYHSTNKIKSAHSIQDDKLASDIPTNIDPQKMRRFPKKTPNNIQIKLHAKSIDKKIDLRRLFAQIGAAPEAQVVAAIEFLQSNATNLNSTDTQTILFMLLFDKGLLGNEMNVNPNAILALLKIIDSGLQFYTQDGIKQPSAFYFKVNAFLRQSLLSIEPSSPSYQQMLQQSERILDKLKQHHNTLSQISQKDAAQSALQKELDALLLIELNNALQLNKKLTQQQLILFYRLNFEIRFNKDLAKQGFLNKEVEDALFSLRGYAISHPDLTNRAVVTEVCNGLDVGIDTNLAVIRFPVVSQGDVKIDLINANIISRDAQLSPLTREAYKNPAVAALFGSDDIIARKLSYTQYEFRYHGEDYRIDYSDYRAGGLQRKMSIQDEESSWYQLLQNTDHIPLPKTFLNNKHWIWQNQNGDLIVINKATNKRSLVYSSQDRAAFILDDNGTRIKQMLAQTTLTNAGSDLSFLTKFEDNAYIEVTQNLQDHSVHINLPRYGLSFTSKIINGQTYFVSDDDHSLCLIRSNQSPLEFYDRAITLASVPNDNDAPKPVKTLMAMEIPNGNRATKSDILHHATYFHTGHELEPASGSDAYYLALMNLATGNAKKGYEIIAKHAHMFIGSAQELQSLCAITALSATQQQATNAEQLPFHSPALFAAKMMACLTVVQYLRQGHTIRDITDTLKNDSQNKKEAENLILFLQSFKTIAAESMKEYLVIKDYIPASMRLKRRDELAILDYAKQETPNFFLDIQTKKKALKNILKEYYQLARQNTQNNAKTKQRLAQLKEKLLKEHHFVPQVERLAPKAYDLTKRDVHISGFSISRNRSTVRTGLGLDQSNTTTLSIDQLNQETTAEDISANLIALFHEAANNTTKAEKLHQYLNAKLRTFIATAERSKPDALKITQEQMDDLDLPDFMKNLIENLDGIKIPESFKPDQNFAVFSLLKAMISDKEKVHQLIKQVNSHNRNDGLRLYNAAGDSRYVYNLEEAIEFAFSHNNIKFEVPTLQASDGEQQGIKFFTDIPAKTHITFNKTANMTIASMPQILNKLNLSNRLKYDVAVSPKDIEPIFTGKSADTDVFYKSLIQESNDDYIKGNVDTIYRSRLQEQWYQTLHQPETRAQIGDEIAKALDNNTQAFNQLQADIVALLNRGPKDAKAQNEWQLALEAKTRQDFRIEQAFKYFSNGDLTKLKAKHHLDDQEADRLMQLTQRYLLEGTQRQQYARVLAMLDKLDAPDISDENTRTLLNQLGTELTLKRCYDPNKYRDVLLFEYLDNKLVYPKQLNMLEALLKQKGDGSYESVAIQLIMGGGKSKVLLPLLAKMRANGTNLTVIEVPGALLETNFYDLHAVSKKLNQNSHLLKFNRNIDADSNYYYRMRQHLRSVIANKEYLVTTRESVQSIVLKYVDVLTNPIEDLVEWEKQIKYLDDIVSLFKEKGEGIIDEIDLNLRTRDQLIYTIGEGKQTPKYVIESIMGLYKSFAHINRTIQGENVNLHDVVSLKCEKPGEADLALMLEQLRHHLLNSQQSPIAEMIKSLNAAERKEIDNFLKNQFTKVPDCIQKMSIKDKSILAVYKEHFNRLLPLSLSRKLYENFGLSKDPKKHDMDREIAIPYVSNNIPNESAKFQNHLLTMNYTIQTHLVEDLSLYVFNMMLSDFKSRLLAEINLNAYAKNPTHQVEKEFAALFGNHIDLKSLDINDQQRIEQYHQQFKTALNVKEYSLQNYILPSILTNPLTLCSNDQNHVSIYKSVIGFTGTDYNHRCFHDSIKRENTDSFGTDGQTISHLIRKERQTHVLEENTPTILFDLLEKHDQLNDVRAIIDVGAQFKGISNRDVANNLAKFYQENPECNIRQILYFNSDNLLCALKVSENPEHEEPFVLGSSDDISGKLGCDPSQYFTYYDQAHTTGTDIKQAPNTIGITTVSEKVMLRDILQAVMRLRDLKDSHHIEFAVMQSLVKENPSIRNWDTKTILNICLQYQAKTLMQEHLSAAFNKINNVTRENLLSQIRDCNNVMDKMILADAYKQLLYQYDEATLFDKYGMPESLIQTEEMLKIARDNAIQSWKTCLGYAQQKVDPNVLKTIADQMDSVIAKSVKICAKQQRSPLNSGCDTQVISQIEVQNERENERENEIEAQDAKLKERAYKSWEKVDLAKYKLGQVVSLMDLEQIGKAHRVARTWKFDTNIRVSENFYNTCNSAPSDKINTFKKPLFYVMNMMDGKNLTKILITQQEATELRAKLNDCTLPQGRKIWINTPSGIPYAGNEPDAAKLPKAENDRLNEQVYFFNADVIYLAANYGSLTWIKEQAEDKINYLEQEILPLHPSKGATIAMLKEILRQDGKLKSTQTKHDKNIMTNTSWRDLHDAYFYNQSNKAPEHTKAEYARLKSYARHRDKIGFFSLRAKWQERKQAIYAWFIRMKNKAFRWLVNFALQNYEPSLLDFIKSKRRKVAFYSLLSSIASVASTALWYFGFASMLTLTLTSWAITAVVLARNVWCYYAKHKYDNVMKVENISNSWELYALKSGVESSTYLGYMKGLFKPTCYLYPKAYYAGLEIGCDSTQGVLADEIKRKKL